MYNDLFFFFTQTTAYEMRIRDWSSDLCSSDLHCRDKCDMTCLEVGFEMTDRQSVGEYAAFIAEPVQGAGGICVPPEGYFRKAKDMCEERGLLLILDEAQTSLGDRKSDV